MTALRKSQSHGRIGEACVTAKCWMNGIPAHNTNALRANFSGSDILIDTDDPRRKLLVQVKTGYANFEKEVYITQSKGPEDLVTEKFSSDFVVLVNIEEKVGNAHSHDGSLDFEHLAFYVIPADVANTLYREALQRQFDRLKRNGERRSLTNVAVYVAPDEVNVFRDKWSLLKTPRVK